MMMYVIQKVYDVYRSRKYRKLSAIACSEFKDGALQIENLVTETQNRIFRERGTTWRDKWNGLKKSKDNISLLVNRIDAPYIQKGVSERAAGYELFYNNMKKLELCLDPLKVALERNTEMPEAEIAAIDKYVGQLDFIRREGLDREFDFGYCLKDFERKEPKSVMATLSANTRSRWFPESVNDALSGYMSMAFSKLRGTAPIYAPGRGVLGNKDRWRVEMDKNNFNIDARYEELIAIRPCFTAEVSYTTGINSRGVLQTAGRASKKGQYGLKCFVLENTPEATTEFVDSFTNSNLALYCFDLKTKKLHYNKEDGPTAVFSRYFNPKAKKPISSRRGLMRAIEEDNEVSLSRITTDLRLPKHDIRKLIRDNVIWEKYGTNNRFTIPESTTYV